MRVAGFRGIRRASPDDPVACCPAADCPRSRTEIHIGRAERDAAGFRNERVTRLNASIQDARHFLDVAALFDGRGEPSGLFFDNTHYAEPGHELVAQCLLQWVRPGGEIFAQLTSRSGSAGSSAAGLCTEASCV